MKIKQSVINTFKRVGIPYEELQKKEGIYEARNRFSGETCQVSYLIGYLIQWVYMTSDAYERGERRVSIDDFDRIRYFILEQDRDAYMTCID